MNGLHKDVFIIHSEGDKREAALAGALIPRLLDIDISVWVYKDWNWENQVDRRGHDALSSPGWRIDPVQYLAGSPTPFRARSNEIDESTLARMLHESTVVLMCEPRHGAPTEGVLKEFRILANLAARPLLVHVLWSDSSGEFFAALRPAMEVRLSEMHVSVAVIDEVFAAVVSAWLAYMLRLTWGREGGERLLTIASRSEPAFKSLIERIPRNNELENLARVGDARSGPATSLTL